MFSGYEMPLFEWFDIEVEFERYRAHVLEGMRELWPRARDDTDEELVYRFWRPDFVTPIDLDLYERKVERKPRGVTFEYEVHISYAGDDELWRLFPGPLKSPLPHGEIFRGALVLSFLASGDAEANRIVESRLSEIHSILDRQRTLIEAFHAELPIWICIEAGKLRDADPPPGSRGVDRQRHLARVK